MSGLNQVNLIGRLGQDPVIRHTASGDAVANISVATSESWKDKNGDKNEKTEWHKVVAFGKLAEIMEKWIKKGSQVYIQGKIQTRKWQDKEGRDNYTTEIVAKDMVMLGGANKSSPESESESEQPYDKSKAVAIESFDDDVPF